MTRAAFCLLFIAVAAKTRWFELEAKSYDFAKYKTEFARSYSAAEEPLRKKIFAEKLAVILAHNRDPTKTWKMGVNQFTDRTEEEYRRVLGVKRGMLYTEPRTTLPVSPAAPAGSPPIRRTVDWRQENVVSTVKDQGQCGSCWSFSAVETVESYWALATGQLPVLSEQYVLDCTANPKQCGGTGGCGGATVSLAMATMIAGGAPQEFTYPYSSYFGANQSCMQGTPLAQPFARLSQHIHLPSNQQEPILRHLSEVGPLSGVVDASGWGSYETGVFQGCSVNATIDHGIQIVGYGHDAEQDLDYWLIRNSWNPGFGEEGYIRILRTPSASCGWDNNPLDGSGCPGGPSRVPVCGECAVLYSASYVIVKN